MICPDCNGSGCDHKKTIAYRKTVLFEMQGGYIMCRMCIGNGRIQSLATDEELDRNSLTSEEYSRIPDDDPFLKEN